MTTLFDLFPQELKDQIINAKLIDSKDSEKVYAFQRVKKLPLFTLRNVQSAMTHIFNVKGVTNAEVAEAYKKIIEKAEEFKICTMGFRKEYEQYINNAHESLKTK